MRNRYWRTVEAIKFKLNYYENYRDKAKSKDNWITAICLIATSAGISLWLSSSNWRWLWALLVGVSQILQAIKPVLPFSKQFNALNYLIPETKRLFTDAEYDYLLHKGDSENDAVFLGLVHSYDLRWMEIENRYTGNIYMPRNGKCEKLANKENDSYFSHRYGLGGSEDAGSNEPTEPTETTTTASATTTIQ